MILGMNAAGIEEFESFYVCPCHYPQDRGDMKLHVTIDGVTTSAEELEMKERSLFEQNSKDDRTIDFQLYIPFEKVEKGTAM